MSGIGNVVDISWWRPRASVSKLCCRGKGGGKLLESSFDDFRRNTIEKPGTREDDKIEHFETLMLLRNAYSLLVYQEFLGYIYNELNEKLVEGTIFSVARVDVWIVTVLQYLAEQETQGGNCHKTYSDTFERNLKNNGREDCRTDSSICKTVGAGRTPNSN